MMSYELNYQLNNYIMKKTNATRVNVMNIRDCNKLSDPPIPYYVISGELVFVLSGKISDIFINSGKEIPFLIPGVGAQGGSIEEVIGVGVEEVVEESCNTEIVPEPALVT